MRRAVGGSVVALGLFAFLLGQAQASPNWQLAVLAAVSLSLELLAVAQKRFGLFSAAFSCNLAAALTPGVGPGVAALLVVAGVGVRTLVKGARRRGRPDWPARAREALSDVISQLVPLAFLHFYQRSDAAACLGALALYLPLTLLLPAWLAEELAEFDVHEWREVRWLTGFLYFSLGFLGIALALAMAHGKAEGLWLLPVLFILQRSARTEALRLEVTDNERLRAAQEKTRLELALASASLQRTQGDLLGKIEELAFLEECARHLARSPGLEGTVEAVLTELLRLTRCPTAALWVCQGDRLRSARRHNAPDDLEESVLRDCLRAGKPRRLEWARCTGWLCPLEGEGVLFVGRERFSAEEESLLRLLVGQAALGLQSARRYEEQRLSLHQLAVANDGLRLWLERMVFLLEGARALSATLETAVLLDRFAQLMESLCPTGAVVRGAEVAVQWGSPGADPVALADSLPSEQALALRSDALAVRLVDEGGPLGCLLLFGSEFPPEMQRVVQLAGYHLASALRSADYHARVKEALEELRQTQAQLVQSSKMAAMGQFAAGVAHEINSPLAAITVALESAEARLDDPEATRRRLGLARKAVDKATAIIRKLLYYSREGSQGRQTTSLGVIVRDTLEIFGPQIEKDGLALEYRCEAEPQVEVNENEIQQVLVNLLLNARDATAGQSSRRVVLRSLVEEDRAVLEVADNGPGIPEEIQARIFEPFFTTKDVGEGTGLGLSVSYQIAQHHGGELALKASSGEGTAFRLYLPL